MSTAVVWFRKDLRLRDNPAWSEATRQHERVVALFVVEPAPWDRVSDRRVALLAGHLRALDARLGESGGRLRVERGDPAEVVLDVAQDHETDVVFVNADVTRHSKRRDAAVAERLNLRVHHGTLIHAPGTILTRAGERYRVFTPFSRSWMAEDIDRPESPGSAEILGDPGSGIPETTTSPMEPGEVAAFARLRMFDPSRYRKVPDRADLDATSRLSIDLKYGVLSPVTIHDHIGRDGEGAMAFVRQLAWRDFHAHLHDENPDLVDPAMRPDYDAIRWREDPEGLEACKAGQTGYPW